ncbi:ATPase of HSP90 chaperone/DNA topoisomerase II/histidine kinase [Glarea lozoyensis ATCC 20868]|uniref:ATPase of HSP90 chaperone/DNA topoisomerase II/histidine kinase n=2 Tax=Glarea lozoyensis TaxID=101852 RepID=S3D7L2_GLAL2|nr:ATPase of HSP90 chaperone/DNA topoisomerase II/histidine kinase [Glarea lozoyensis ATCC 20868]EPE28001.1 ATPase of HSP90 chaperone/DNA topoisomerase II/histidine kinase [Glarea lozoyensis ATCC 20868]
MAIAALPQSTIHLLGSAQVLTSTTSLVKELIDNALDAKATSVEVLLSQNTLDKIQVRDNGHGIQHDDLDALGRRGHTSKLRSFEDLRSIGGVSLGFRGEALASAVQLGKVSVTTRTEGEAVATSVTLKAPGGIAKQSKTSHPIGTTVTILNFMSKLPVRKQTALKSASKTLVKTKELLQAYALARPSIRFSLKITKDSKGSWSFAPRPNDGVKEAVSHIIGKEASMQCLSKTLTFSEPRKTGDNEFHVEIYLPKPDADISKVGHGQYLSIDSRPVSHEKGTMKKIVSLFKSYLKVGLGEAREVRNPFIRININCPLSSYDPNVEPAKDDVIFGNESLILDPFESFFKDLYGEKESASNSTSKNKPAKPIDNFELLLARNPVVGVPSLNKGTARSDSNVQLKIIEFEDDSASAEKGVPDMTQDENSLFVPEAGETSPAIGKSRRSWGIDMSRDFDEVVTDPRSAVLNRKAKSSPAAIEDDSSNTLNPWVIAKMTAPLRTNAEPVAPTDQESRTPGAANDQYHIIDGNLIRRKSQEQLFLESPVQKHGSVSRRTPKRRYSNEARLPNPNTPKASLYELDRGTRHRSEDGNIYLEQRAKAFRDTTLETPDIPSLHRRQEHSSSEFGHELPNFNEQSVRRRQNDFVSARSIKESFLLTPPATQRQKPSHQSDKVNKPFAAPRRIADTTSTPTRLQQTRLPTFQGQQDFLGVEEPQSELEWAMQYEQNKESASRTRRDQLRLARKDTETETRTERTKSSPHKNRYNAAIAALEGDAVSKPQEPKTSLPPNDPRAYLMKHQALSSTADGEQTKAIRNTRAKSTKLPLEKIPDHLQTHKLVLNLSTDMEKIKEITEMFTPIDAYISQGRSEPGLELSVAATKDLSRDIKRMVDAWVEKQEDRRDCEVEYLFANLNSVEA